MDNGRRDWHERKQCKINRDRDDTESDSNDSACAASVFSQEAMSDPPGKKVAVTVTKDMSFDEIAALLKDRELIRDKNVFRMQYMLSEYKGKIEPGSYVLNTSQTADEMLKVLSRADEKETETE